LEDPDRAATYATSQFIDSVAPDERRRLHQAPTALAADELDRLSHRFRATEK
jgi:hypothetical protein